MDSLVERLKDIHIEGKELSDIFRNEFNTGKAQLDAILKKHSEVLASQTDGIISEVQGKVKKSQERSRFSPRKNSESWIKSLRETRIIAV